jgi:hypothetical protein
MATPKTPPGRTVQVAVPEAGPKRTAVPYAGIWIDQREAVIIRGTAEGAEVRSVKNDLAKHKAILNLKHKGTRSGTHFINQEKKEPGKLHKEMTDYLARVVKELGSVKRVIVFGPAEAKVELDKYLREKKPRIVCERMTTGPMTRNQKVAWVKRYFT